MMACTGGLAQWEPALGSGGVGEDGEGVGEDEEVGGCQGGGVGKGQAA